MRLTHLGSSSPVSVHFVFIRARSSSFAGVVSVFVHGRLSSFMGGVHVLGVRHSCGGVVVVRVVVCGHRVVVRGW